ncbi:TPA: G5 domain-containing protein, partial [Streptococcus suis]|nr:G5 domain-containing protein [Streptococcus suis]
MKKVFIGASMATIAIVTTTNISANQNLAPVQDKEIEANNLNSGMSATYDTESKIYSDAVEKKNIASQNLDSASKSESQALSLYQNTSEVLESQGVNSEVIVSESIALDQNSTSLNSMSNSLAKEESEYNISLSQYSVSASELANYELSLSSISSEIDSLKSEQSSSKSELASLSSVASEAQKEYDKTLKDSVSVSENIEPYYDLDVEFKVSADFVNALIEREKINNAFRGENYPFGVFDTPEKVSTINVEDKIHKDNYNGLSEIVKKDKLLEQFYDGSQDMRKVDLYDMTEDQLKEINLFGTNIINKIRAEVRNAGVPGIGEEVATTQAMLDFATDVTKGLNLWDKAKKVTYDGKHTLSETYASYHYDLLYDMAKKNGLRVDTTSSPNKDAVQLDLQTEISPGIYKDQKHSDMSIIKDNIESPIMTMGTLKELVFDGFKKLFFENNYSERRAYEQALSIAGILFYRRAEFQPNTVVSVAPTLVKQAWGLPIGSPSDSPGKHRFQLHLFQESGNLVAENKSKHNGMVTGFTNDTPERTKVLKNGVKQNNTDQVSNELSKLKEKADTASKAYNELLVKLTEFNYDKKIETLSSNSKSIQEILNNLNESINSASKELTSKSTKLENATNEYNQLLNDYLSKLELFNSKNNNYNKLLEAKEALENAKSARIQAELEFHEACELLKNTTKPEGQIIISNGSEHAPIRELPVAKIELKEVLFETDYKNDPTLELGKEVVVREGQKGSVQVITIGDQVTEIVLTEKVDKLVKRGTLVK